MPEVTDGLDPVVRFVRFALVGSIGAKDNEILRNRYAVALEQVAQELKSGDFNQLALQDLQPPIQAKAA